MGKIVSVSDHENADKLYVVAIDDGSESGRTICAGLKEYYAADEMVGKSVVFVANLKPRKLRGVMSEGMMLAAKGNGNAVSDVGVAGLLASAACKGAIFNVDINLPGLPDDMAQEIRNTTSTSNIKS